MSEFSINVKYQATNNVKIEVSPKTSIAELKEKLNSHTSIPVNEIKLIYKGKILKVDNDTMEDLNIVADCSLHMIQNKPSTTETNATIPTTPNVNTSSPFGNMNTNSAAPNLGGLGGLSGLGGMGGMGGLQGMNPEMIQQMMNNPAVAQMAQQLFSNPQMLQDMIGNNPMLSQMVANNPQLQGILNNPDMIQQALGSFGGAGANRPAGNPTPANTNAPAFDINSLLNNPMLAQQLGNNAVNLNQPPNQNYEELYKDQLKNLESMGFTNKDLNIDILKQCYGNVDAAVEKLLNLFK